MKTVMNLPATQSRTPPPHLLLVDDDLSLGKMIREYCETRGISVTPAATGEEALYLSQQKRFQLIILDVMLPRMNGFEVLRRIRLRSDIPVLMLTTRGAARDRIQGLQNGADDYLPKPFEPEELIARVRSILRRTYPVATTARLEVGDLTLDVMERSVLVAEDPVELTGAEFRLLHLLLKSPGDAHSREELVPQIFERDVTSSDRSIDNLASSLRRKLGDHPSGAERIKGIRGVGYTYVVEKTVL
jgi:DNA-binding response OmpR family regulator